MYYKSMSLLTDKVIAIVFAYAPAGLGHLRVSRALRLGLPAGTQPILLPDPAASVQSLHRLTSNTPLGRRILEFGQYGWTEEIFTKLYRSLLVRDAWRLEKKLLDVLKQQVELPSTLLLIATHFGIAHQVSAIKKSLEKKGNIRVILVVQVTDDSPQKMWYVPNADCIVVPSEYTRQELLIYKRIEHLLPSRVVTLPYPVSPELNTRLSGNELDAKKAQADPTSNRRIQVCVPLSGAQVGMNYASTLMHTLHRINDRMHFHIVGKRTMFSELYLSSWNGKSYATTYESHSDRQIVELYEEAYQETVFLAEITKPSEQTFKALLSPTKRGGVILLFTEPVGRQEYDNLNFLRRHHLIPTEDEQNKLYDVSKRHERFLSLDDIRMLKTCRGLVLPKNPTLAAQFIDWLQKTKTFEHMMKYEPRADSPEVSDAGVRLFWEHVGKLL